MSDYYFCPVLNFGKKGTFFSCRPRWTSNQLQHGSLADSESGHMNQIDMMLPDNSVDCAVNSATFLHQNTGTCSQVVVSL